MAWLWLLLAFVAFMALLRSVYAVNRAAVRRFGYAPFSLPNAALMLITNLLLLSALAPLVEGSGAGDAALPQVVKLAAAAVLAAGLLAIIARRSNLWYALYAVVVMGLGAVAVFPSLVFMRLAGVAENAEAAQSREPPDREAS